MVKKDCQNRYVWGVLATEIGIGTSLIPTKIEENLCLANMAGIGMRSLSHEYPLNPH